MEVWQTQGSKKFGIFTSRLRRSEKNQKLEKGNKNQEWENWSKDLMWSVTRTETWFMEAKKVPSTYIFWAKKL